MKKIMGLGTVFLMFSSLIFIISNYGISIGLARFLGPEQFGVYGVLMSLYLINRAFLNTGVPKAVSKFISEAKNNTIIRLIFKQSFFLQLIMGTVIALIYVLFSPLIANLLNDSNLTKQIYLIGVIIVPLSLLSLYLNGFFNGLRMFKKQAAVSIIYSVLRIFFVLSLAFLGLRIIGALVGYLIAILITLIISMYMLKISGKDDIYLERKIDRKKIVFFALPITIAALGFTLMRNVNVLFIKLILEDNILSGYYTSAITLSNASYLIFLPLTSTLMPSISRSISQKNLPLTKKYISQALRYLLLFLFPITVLIAATSTELISLVYSKLYSPAGSVLTISIIGSAFLVIFSVLIAIITGSGKPKIEMFIGIISLFLLITLDFYLIPIFGINGAALAYLITSFVALIFALLYVYLKFGFFMTFLSFTRITFASLIIFLMALFLKPSGVSLVIYFILFLVVYFCILFITHEISNKDIIFFKSIIKGLINRANNSSKLFKK